MSNRLSEVRSILNFNGDNGVLNITPKQAVRLLEVANIKNRKVSARNVDLLKRQMVDGSFKLSNDAICFNSDGVLTNGQHRLTALALCDKDKSVKGIEFLVAFGIDNFMGMDTGKVRSIADNYSIFEDGSKLSDPKYKDCLSVAKDVCYYCNGVYNSKKYTQDEYRQICNFLAEDLIACADSGIFATIKGITAVPVKTAFFLAYVNGVSLGVLKHIHEVLKEGVVYSDFDKPVLALIKGLININGGGREPGQKRLELTMDCIDKVCRKSKAKYLKPKGIIYTYKEIPFAGKNTK